MPTTRFVPLPLPQPDQAVPERYQGVWVRTLLDTPDVHDTTSRVHWLQTDLWHADLRLPGGADPITAADRARLQGFCGITAISPGQNGQPDTCTWHRRWDIQPPRRTPDAGHMVFETTERLVETGIHGRYLEVWERLPESVGLCQSYEGLDAEGHPNGERLLVAGTCFMHVRPRSAPWPADLRPDESLADVLVRHPDLADELLSFDIRYGQVKAGLWTCLHGSTPRSTDKPWQPRIEA